MKIVNPALDDYPVILDIPKSMKRRPEVADLKHWVRQNKLQWLDLSSAELPLRSGPVTEFPYADIEGYGRGFVYFPKPLQVPFWAFWRKRRMREDGKIELL